MIITIIKQGLKWTWVSPPTISNCSQQHQDPLLGPHISSLLQRGIIFRSNFKTPYISRVFTVPKKNGETRMILDLSRLNKFIPDIHFKMENHEDLRKVLTPGAWFTSIDLKDAYLHIPVHPEFQPFLSFTYQEEVFSFKSMCFGLCLAPRIFTKIMVWVRKLITVQGIRVMAYLDDLIIWADSKELSEQHTKLTLQILQELGFLINFKKSSLVPTQKITWLGVFWDSAQESVSLPQGKQIDLAKQARKLRGKTLLPLKRWQSFLGSIAFASQVLPLGRLEARKLALTVKLADRVWIGFREAQQAIRTWSDRRFRNLTVPWRFPTALLTV